MAELLSYEENDALYALVAAGDDGARQRMIEGNMRLVQMRVDDYLATRPWAQYLADDLYSEGILALTEAVNKMGRITKQNVTGYINKSVSRAIDECADRDRGLNVPARTQRDVKARGGVLPMQVVAPPGLFESIPVDHTSVIELRDEIDACAETDFERKVVQMRADGHKDREIAESLGVSLMKVYRARQHIYTRWKERQEDEEEYQ